MRIAKPITPTLKPIETARAELNRVTEAETAIAAILLRLEQDTGKSIDVVNVDTRNWGRLATEIFLTTTPRQ